MTDTQLFIVHGAYLLAAALFVIGLRRLSRVRTARSGNTHAAVGMLIAVVATLYATTDIGWLWILAGVVVGGGLGAILANTVAMTAMPELVAFFNGMGGAASAAVSLSFLYNQPFGQATETFASMAGWHIVLVVFLSIVVGTLTLTGSLIAFGKLSGKITGDAVLLPGRHVINILLLLATIGAGVYAGFVSLSPTHISLGFIVVAGIAALLGILLVIPIGGADMPVVISLLNSYSGIAASMAGFVLLGKQEPSAYMLVISGALVGASGLILTNLMCRAMNRSLGNVLLGGFGETAGDDDAKKGARDYKNIKSFSAEEAAMILDGAELVIVVPGYGLAVAQAQHAMAELEDLLEKRGTQVKYAIHPVAGRMPGHMNVLLAEANVDYEKLYDLDINSEFRNAQAAIVVGANDVVNPAALNDPKSPIAGMPILTCHEAQNVIVIKRSLSPGYAGIKNELFEYDNTMMLFSDAKQAMLDISKEIKEL
jgi:NAD(P) transhydrogenase subunit beta